MRTMSPTEYRLLIVVYCLAWAGCFYVLWLWHDVLPWVISFVLGSILVGGMLPSIRDLLILFASNAKVQERMDRQREHSAQIVAKKEEELLRKS